MKSKFAIATLNLSFFVLTISGVGINYVPLYAQNDSTTRTENKGYRPDLTLNNIFTAAVGNQTPPRIIDTLEMILESGAIVVKKIRFESLVDEDRTNRIFSYLIYPKDKKDLPAILILHGGTQTADDYYKLGIQFARRGYAALIPDLPGITSPEWANRKGNGSTGRWAEYPYGQNHFLVRPDGRASNIYEGVVAAIQAFYLLKSQFFVDPSAMGIRGLSWGGYAAVMTTALLGNQVKAGFAVYGSGFYDLPSYFKSIVDTLDEPARVAWLSALDAGRYAGRIQAPFYFMAASNDTYFHPPPVEATYNQINGTKHILFSPNNDHSLSNTPDPEATEFAFFDYYLRRQGVPLPQIALTANKLAADQSRLIEFAVKGNVPVRETRLWYSISGADWMKRTWKSVKPTALGTNRFRTVLPTPPAGATLNWYVTVTDERTVSSGTVIH